MWPACTFVLVDPDPWFRRGLELTVHSVVAYRVSGSVATLAEVQPPMFAAPPVCLVVDLDHAVAQGQPSIDSLLTTHGDVRMMVLAPAVTSEALLAALRVHAYALVTRTDQPQTFLDIVWRVLHGEQVINHMVGKGAPFRRVMRVLHAPDQAQIDANKLLAPLTHRQLELLQLLAAGMRLDQIAATFGENRRRTADHLLRICARLGVNDRHQAVVLALKQGWISLPPLVQNGAGATTAPIDVPKP